MAYGGYCLRIRHQHCSIAIRMDLDESSSVSSSPRGYSRGCKERKEKVKEDRKRVYEDFPAQGFSDGAIRVSA